MESTTNSDIRINNRKRILNLLFKEGQMTKQEVAHRLDISLPTVSSILKEFTEIGLITTGKEMESTGGRKAICHCPVYDVKYSLGVHASEHGLRLALVDLGANVIAKNYYPLVRENAKEYWTQVNEILRNFGKKYVGDPNKFLNVGITLDIPMSHGEVISRKNEVQDEGIDLELARKYLNPMVSFRNAAKMSAIAEIWKMDNRDSFVFVALGNHVGGALVCRGDLLDFSYINGEFGDIVFCGEGKKKRAEDVLGIRALCMDSGVKDLKALELELIRGNAQVLEIWEIYLKDLSGFLYNLYCTFGWKIVVGGYMSPLLRRYKEKLDTYFLEINEFEKITESPIIMSELGKHGAVIGAALFPVDHFLDTGYDEL